MYGKPVPNRKIVEKLDYFQIYANSEQIDESLDNEFTFSLKIRATFKKVSSALQILIKLSTK